MRLKYQLERVQLYLTCAFGIYFFEKLFELRLYLVRFLAVLSFSNVSIAC